MASHLYVGMGPPNTIRLDVSKATDDTDFVPGDVTGASIEVTRSDGTTASWTASVSNVTSTGLRVSYVLATSDVTVSGPMRVWVKLLVPSGWVRTETSTVLALKASE